MKRRRPPREEAHFGSDSFLDVVANVVGILIILMVLAGIRAKTAPIKPNEVMADAAVAQPAPAATVSPDDAEKSQARQREVAALQSQADTLQSELERLRQTSGDQETKLSELQSQDAVQRN